MKKQAVMLLLAAGLLLSCVGCGNKAAEDKTETQNQASSGEETQAQTSDGISSADYDPDAYVTLPDLEGLSATTDVYNFTEEDVKREEKNQADYFIQNSGIKNYKTVDKDTVEDGDIVNIDYKGLKDGVAFDGGTAQGAHLTIGSGQFIDGFESGLIGHKVGEDVSLNLTFPEEYHSEELAGAAVVFEVKINSIEEETEPVFNDELVASLGLGVNTVDEFNAKVREGVEQNCQEKNDTARKTAVWEAVFNASTVKEPPEEFVKSIADQMKSNLAYYAQQYQISEDDFIANYLGTTPEEYEVESKETATTAAKEKLVTAAIARKVGITVTDADLLASATAMANEYGYESAEQYLQEKGRANFYDYLLGEKVDEYLAGVVKVTENAPVSMFAEQAEE